MQGIVPRLLTLRRNPMSSAKAKSDVSLKFKGEKEKELINHTKKIYESVQPSLVKTYWWIGKNISNFYEKKKKYGEETLKKIAEKTGIHENTLSKAYQFARQYTKEQMTELITGNFTVSWHIVANNLTIDSEKFMKAYQKSDSTEKFCNRLTKLKPPRQKKEVSGDLEDEDPDDQEDEDSDDPDDDDSDDPDDDDSDDPDDVDDPGDQEEDKTPAKKSKKKGEKGNGKSSKSEDKTEKNSSDFDGKCKYPSPKLDFLLIAEFKKAKAKSITPKSFGIGCAYIARRLFHMDYIVSLTPVQKSTASPKKKKRA
jgi:hypothetical protein